MAREEKPYRVYRGGRAKGKVPSVSSRAARARRGGGRRDDKGDSRVLYRGPGARSDTAGRPRWGRRIAIGLVVLLLVVVVWAVASWFAFSSGVSDADKRLDPNAKSALTPQSGLLLSHSTTVLLLGTDNARVGGREGDRHSDSILLLRTDPSHHRLYYLSIPRDLVVPIPGYSTQKVNAAFQIGGPALAIRTIRQLSGRFAKGNQHMNGERALIYSRIRENMLDPAETDVTRGARQQQVIDAVTAKFTSPGTLAKLPFDGSSVAKPLTTDLSAGQLAQLGWVKFRSSSGSSIHCRLGGDLGGGGTGSPSEDNPATIAMFLGKSAPQPPTGQFNPGCVIGRTLQ